MGKSNAKTPKPCGYIKPHKEHVWEQQSPQPNVPHRRRYFCKGVAQAASAPHKHAWESTEPIREVYDDGVLRGEGALWQGPFECSCGMSRWLTDGRVETRFPIGEPMDRIMALRAKLARGKEDWTAEDQAELEAIGAALAEAFKPIVDALVSLAETVGSYIQAFIDRIDPETMALLIELTKSYSGEKPDAVETVDLVGSDGKVIATHVVSYDPIAAVPATALLSDEDQIGVIQEAYDIDSPQMEPRGFHEIHIEPVEAYVRGKRIDLPRGGMAMNISEADYVINLPDEVGPSTAHIGPPRAQSFRRASES